MAAINLSSFSALSQNNSWVQEARNRINDLNESRAQQMRDAEAERQSRLHNDGSQQPLTLRSGWASDISSLSSGQASTTDNQQQTFDTYSSNGGIRLSSGATQNNLSDAGTSNVTESSSAEIDSKASQTRLHSGRLQPTYEDNKSDVTDQRLQVGRLQPAQSLQAYQQAEAAQLAEANQGPRSVLSLFG